MKRIASLFVALGLATAGSTALAEQAKDELNRVQKAAGKPQPVQMTEAQLDKVAGGLITVVVVDTVDVSNVANRNEVAVPVTASVAAAVLGVAGSAAKGSPVIQ